MPTNDRPVKLDMSFEEAIQFFAKPRSKRKGSPPAESGNTTEASPESDPSDRRTSQNR